MAVNRDVLAVASQVEISLETDSAAAIVELLKEGRTLPSSWFSSDEIFEFEQRHIFGRAWTYVAGANSVADPGDFMTCTVANIPVVIVRGKDKVLRAFVNICRHRHHQVAIGSGNRSTLQCMYHGWTYKLDGRFNAAPRSKEANFDGSNLCLKQLRVGTVGDMLFVNPDLEAPELDEVMAPIPEIAEKRGLPLGEAKFRARRSLTYKANWKIVYENNAECYHCPTCHTSWYKEVRLDPQHYNDRRVGSFHYETDMDLYEGKPHDYAYYVWPAFYFMNGSLKSDAAEAVGRSGYVSYTFFPISARETVMDADLYHVDPISQEEADEWFDSFFPIVEEDLEICERVQSAHDSGVGEPGTLVMGIDSEQHTLLWEQLVHRSLTRPEVPLYEPLLDSLPIP